LTADLAERSIERVPVNVENVVATTSDMINNIIYWSDMESKMIMKMKKGEGAVPLIQVRFIQFTGCASENGNQLCSLLVSFVGIQFSI